MSRSGGGVGSGIGSGVGSGCGAGTGSGTGSGVGSGCGVGSGSGVGAGCSVAAVGVSGVGELDPPQPARTISRNIVKRIMIYPLVGRVSPSNELHTY